MGNYHAAGNLDRLYEQAMPMMESCGYDIELAGATLMGHDIGLTVEADTRAAILAILKNTAKRDRLTVHMSRAQNIDVEIPSRLIDQLEKGIELIKL